MKQFFLCLFLSLVMAGAEAQDTIDYQVSARPKIKQSSFNKIKDRTPEIDYAKLNGFLIKSPFLKENSHLNVKPLYRVFTPQELENKVVVLVFWSAACDACTDNFSNLSNILKQYKYENDLAVIAITNDGSRIAMEKLALKPLLFTEFINNGQKVTEDYKPDNLPAYVIADRSHTIRYAVSGSSELILPAFKEALATSLKK